METNASRPAIADGGDRPILFVELTRQEAAAMAMAKALGVYPVFGDPYESVRRAANQQFPKGIVLNCIEIFCSPIRSNG
mgnify:CR=1 FL=1